MTIEFKFLISNAQRDNKIREIPMLLFAKRTRLDRLKPLKGLNCALSKILCDYNKLNVYKHAMQAPIRIERSLNNGGCSGIL